MPKKTSPVNQIYMERAIELAKQAAALGEVPVGAVIVYDLDSRIISEAHNLRETNQDPLGHAETIAISRASKELRRWRLTGCTIYVTLEPCLMCSGAVVLSRLDRVVYGARDPKAGAVESLYTTLADIRLNHRPEVVPGLCEEQCSSLLKDFFRVRRGPQPGS